MTFRDIFSTTLPKKELERLDNLYNRSYSRATQRSMLEYSEDSNIVNKAFRKHNGNWNKDLEIEFGLTEKQFMQMYTNLDNSQVPLVERTVLYRGISNSVDEFFIDKLINDRGYASTSFVMNVSRHYAGKDGTVLVIDAPKGTEVIYIRQHSIRPNEVEFLFPRGSKLQVYKIDSKNNIAHCKIMHIINYLY